MACFTGKIKSVNIKQNTVTTAKLLKTKTSFFSAKQSYFKEPQPFKLNVLKPGIVPKEIQRPNYMLNKDHNYDVQAVAMHKNKEEIDNHRASCRITAKVLKRIEELSNTNVCE